MLKRYFVHPGPYIAALLLSVLFYSIPEFSQQISQHPTFTYASGDASYISAQLQRALTYPLGKLLSLSQLKLIAIPYLVLLMLFLRAIYIHTKKFLKYAALAIVALFLFLYVFPNSLLLFDNDQPSKAHGHVAKGYIVNSKRVNFRGANFSTYSFLGYLSGRTYTHGKVKELILEAYECCRENYPDRSFILGETGCRKGGRFLPHRTHQNGLSVDFMSPLLKKGKPYRSNHLLNLWGYAFEFDNKGRKEAISIDFEAMAEHLLQLKKLSRKKGLVIQKVIFDPVLQPLLLATAKGDKIRDLPFTKKRVVIRHDDHYHVDFGVIE